MNIFSGRSAPLGVLVVVAVGLAIGVGLARLVAPHSAGETSTRVATHTAHDTVVRSPHAIPATPAPAQTRTATATAAAQPTPAVMSAVAQAVAQNALEGAWQVDEQNAQVGAITWSGQAIPSGDTIVFDVHKVSVAGKPATACERQTILHAVLSMRSIDQGASYTETNCQGASSTGEIRVSSFSPDARSVTGSFWNGQQKIGDFHAERR